MKVLVAGGTGFIGQALIQHFLNQSYEVIVLTRRFLLKPVCYPNKVTFVSWDGKTCGDWVTYLEGVDVVINLAGARITPFFFLNFIKKKILDSRVLSTQALVDAISFVDTKPTLFIQASAVGFYPFHQEGGEACTEQSGRGEGFLSEVCERWESVANLASQEKVNVVIIRLGIVFSETGGFLKLLMSNIRFYMGFVCGSGSQMISWVSLKDVVLGIDFLMTKTSYHGVLNLVSPHPLSLSELMRQFCSLLHRPLLFRIPSFFFRFIFKEAASFFIKGHLVSCHQLLSLGYQFHDLNFNQWIDSYLEKKI